MEKKIDTRKKFINAVMALIMITALLLAAHVLLNYFHFDEIIRTIHGG